MCVGLKIPYIQECFGILKVHEMAVTLKIEFESTHHVGVKISVCNRILIVFLEMFRWEITTALLLLMLIFFIAFSIAIIVA